MDCDKMSILYRGPPIDASYQVSVHLAKQFQRRRFFRNQHERFSINITYFVPIHLQTWPPQAILVSDWSISKAAFPLRTSHRCILPSFGSFGQAVSEEKIF
jgi:hypothetical protein